MKKIITIIICLSVFTLTIAQNEKADAEYLTIKKEYTLNEDGSIDFRYSKELKLLTHYAFHRLYGETFIIYNTDSQSLKINEAYTIMADGKKIVTPDNAFNQVLPRFANNAPAYNHIREMVITHTGLEVGAVIHLDYTIHTEKGFYADLMFDEILTETSPVKLIGIKVNIPESKNLNYKLLNIITEPTIGNKNGNKTYSWTFVNLPASSKDNYQVKDHLDAPRLLVSSADDLKTAYNQFIKQDGFKLEAGECMDETIAEVLSSNPDQLSVALALQKIVSNDLNNLSIPLKYSGFKFRSPAETWKSNQGIQIEKTVLLSALLKKADIKASPVVIIPDQMYDDQHGNLETFNKFAVMVELDGYDKILISADHVNKQSLGYRMPGKTIIKLDKSSENKLVENIPNRSGSILVTGDLNFTTEGPLTGKVTMVLEGNANPYFAIYKDASSVKSALKGGINAKDITKFQNVQLSQDVCRTHFEIEKEKALKPLNSYFSFALPVAYMGVDSWHMNLLPANRNVSLEIGEVVHEKYEYKLSIEDGLKPVLNSTNIEIRNNVGYVHIQIEKANGQLNIKREIKLDKKIIEPADYTSFKAIMDAWNKENYKKVIFKN